MRRLDIYVEISGIKRLCGYIEGNSHIDSSFSYDRDYMDSDYGRAISIMLPFQDEPFSSNITRNFFEGLLPEGFSRRAVANWLKADENDYLAILEGLGKECLGAIMISDGKSEMASHYEKLGLNRVKELAAEGATKSTQLLMETHLSLTGASGKVGLYYDEKDNNWYLPTGNAPSTHIVKLSHVRLNHIVLNEQLCILTARNCDIEVPDSFIVNLGNAEDDEVLYATRRYDRCMSKDIVVDGLICPYRLHQEDFSQALGIGAAEKYEKRPSGYLKRMFETVRKYSSNPLEDQKRLLEIIVFDYFIGNTDCHIKNYSLLYSEDLKRIRLAPAYDIVSTRVYNLTKEMSFFIGGELDITRLTRDTFGNLSDEIGIGKKQILSIYDDISDKFENSLETAASELVFRGFSHAKDLKEKIVYLNKQAL